MRRYSAKETYNFIDPADRSHPIPHLHPPYAALTALLFARGLNLFVKSAIILSSSLYSSSIIIVRHSLAFSKWCWDFIIHAEEKNKRSIAHIGRLHTFNATKLAQPTYLHSTYIHYTLCAYIHPYTTHPLHKPTRTYTLPMYQPYKSPYTVHT